MNPEPETFVLPTAYSFGRLTVYAPGEHQNPQLLEARGTVRAPAGARLFLDVSQELCDDLSKIHLVPARMLANGITLAEKKLGRTNFGELLSLELNCVAIVSCDGIQVEQIRDLGRMKSLEHLRLSNTPLDVPDFSWILQLPNLKSLLLSESSADDSCVGFLVNLQHLEDLHLSHSKITDRGAQAIWRMANIKEVNLGECEIGDTALEGVGSCSSLRSLTVPDTRISDRGVEVIVTEGLRAGQQLTALSLRSCRITDKSVVRLASLKGLMLLDLYSTEVTAEGAAFLKKSLHGCRIFVGRDKGGGPKLWQVDRA